MKRDWEMGCGMVNGMGRREEWRAGKDGKMGERLSGVLGARRNCDLVCEA